MMSEKLIDFAEQKFRKALKLSDETKIIKETPWKLPCEFCGEKSELRPYGPKGENVCFDCAQKDVASAERQMAKRLGIKEKT